MVKYLDLHFEAELLEERRSLPPFLGPTLRGAFGSLLKRAVCQVSHGQCDRCLLRQVCPYTGIFEGIPPEQRSMMRKYPRIPQPFVLCLPWKDLLQDDSQRIEWGLRLFGEAVRYWPYVIHVFRTAISAGIGQRRVRSQLLSVRDGLPGTPFWTGDEEAWREPRTQDLGCIRNELPEHCTLHWKLNTPVQIVREGAAAGTQLDGLDLLLAGRRRFGIMQTFYGQPSEQVEPEHHRFERSDFVTRFENLRHWNITRFSGRQERRIELHGTIGELVIEGPWGLVGNWLPAIQTLHIGKSVTFGLGALSWERIAMS